MTTCQPPYDITDPVIETELGYCFHADIISLIRNLKVGLYDEHYRKVIYLKEFLFMPQMGEWHTGFFLPGVGLFLAASPRRRLSRIVLGGRPISSLYSIHLYY